MLAEYSRMISSDGTDIDSLVRAGIVHQIKKVGLEFKEDELSKVEPAGISSKALLDPTYLDPDLAKDETMRRAFAILMEK
jgi:hypothetical protein